MTWNPDLLLEDFRRVAGMAGVSLAPDAIAIDRRPAPHVPPKPLPPGKMAVYVFAFGQHVLKVGKVGPNSAARYTAQHYNAGSAKSTLAASLIKHGERIGVAGLNETNVPGWIRENHRSGELHPRCGARHPRTQPARSVPAVPPPARVRGILQPTDDRSRGRTGMKEDILEQMVDEYLQHKGYFTRHNIKFRPAGDHAEYDTRQDAVHSDIDVIGIHPRLDGARRVIVVSCKSWQSGFRPEYWIDAIAKNKVVSGREAWRGFRELTKEKWATAFRATVAELTGSSSFTYITAVTKVIGSRSAWQDNATFREHLGGNPIEILTFGDMLKELFPFIDTTPASSQVGRVLQLIKASGWSLDK